MIFGLTVIGADFLSKFLVNTHIPLVFSYSSFPYGGVAIFEDLGGISCSLVHSINKGAAWGILSNYQELLVFFRIGLVSLLFIYVYIYKKDCSYYLPFAFILAGAFGNILDYFVYGHVVDMVFFQFWGYGYPVFNLADSAITLGGFFLLISYYFKKGGRLKDEG